MAADAEQRELERQVAALKTQVEKLQRKLDLADLRNEGETKQRDARPRLLVVGGPERRRQTLRELRRRLNIDFDFVPLEREKGRTQGLLNSLRTRAANGAGVLVVTDCCGHDKRNVGAIVSQRIDPFYLDAEDDDDGDGDGGTLELLVLAGDAPRVRQLVTSLVGNAQRHARNGMRDRRADVDRIHSELSEARDRLADFEETVPVREELPTVEPEPNDVDLDAIRQLTTWREREKYAVDNAERLQKHARHQVQGLEAEERDAKLAALTAGAVDVATAYRSWRACLGDKWGVWESTLAAVISFGLLAFLAHGALRHRGTSRSAVWWFGVVFWGAVLGVLRVTRVTVENTPAGWALQTFWVLAVPGFAVLAAWLVIGINSDFARHWEKKGRWAGELGFPADNECARESGPAPGDRCMVQCFELGGNVVIVHSRIYHEYMKQGGPHGRWGFPLERSNADNSEQRFEGGTLVVR